jgi:flagellar biosynthesis component FlhA
MPAKPRPNATRKNPPVKTGASSPLQLAGGGSTSRYSNATLAVGIVLILGVMILPLPTMFMDILLVMNITVL